MRNEAPLEFSHEPVFLPWLLCITHSGREPAGQFPEHWGEAGPGTPGVAKISCLDERLGVPGLPLPAR